MKKCFLAFLTIIALMLSCNAMTEIEIIPILTLEGKEAVIDPSKPLTSQYFGMYSIDLIMTDGTVRILYQYVPTSWTYRQPEVAIGVPSGEDAMTFFEATGWKALMDKQGFAALLMVAGENGWQTDESEYSAAVFSYMDGREYLQTQDSAFYMVGYGDAANTVMAHAVVNSELFAGFAAFGVDNFDTAILEQGHTTESNATGIMKSQVKVPMWIGATERTAAVEKVIQYWKNANDVNVDPVSNALADEIYAFPRHMILDNDIVDQHVATTRVTIGLEETTKPEFTNELWNNFLRRVRRQDSAAINSLRAFATNDELGMDHETMDIDGITREFWVYIPSTIKSGYIKNAPLVIVFHGGGGSGEEFPNRTGWTRVAEEKECVVAFPTGSRGDTKLKARTTWGTDNDLAFFLKLRNHLLANYPVDSTRVYITGHSAGTYMTHRIAMWYPELIAAVASNDGVVDVNTLDNLKEDIVMPYKVNYGSLDSSFLGDGFSAVNMAATIERLKGRYGITISQDEALTYVNGKITHWIYRNSQGFPVIEKQENRDQTHAYVPDVVYTMYDFLSNYSRGDDGTCYYMGQTVELK